MVNTRILNRILGTTCVCVVLAFAGETAFFAWQAKELRRLNDELADDKAALLLERKSFHTERTSYLSQIAALEKEKARLEGNFVSAMNLCRRYKEEKERLESSLAPQAEAPQSVATPSPATQAPQPEAPPKAEPPPATAPEAAPSPAPAVKSDADSLDELIELVGQDK